MPKMQGLLPTRYRNTSQHLKRTYFSANNEKDVEEDESSDDEDADDWKSEFNRIGKMKK